MSPVYGERKGRPVSFLCYWLGWAARQGERLRDKLAVVVGCAALIACTPDTVHTPILLPPPYAALPAAAAAIFRAIRKESGSVSKRRFTLVTLRPSFPLQELKRLSDDSERLGIRVALPGIETAINQLRG